MTLEYLLHIAKEMGAVSVMIWDEDKNPFNFQYLSEMHQFCFEFENHPDFDKVDEILYKSMPVMFWIRGNHSTGKSKYNLVNEDLPLEKKEMFKRVFVP